MSTVGDLGRRLAERRRAVTRCRGGGDEGRDGSALPGHGGEQPDPQLSRSALWRLAAALDTSADTITGGGMVASAGRGGPQGRPVLDVLTSDECRALIAPGGVGRVVFLDDGVPVALPVNFRTLGDDIVFRTNAVSTV